MNHLPGPSPIRVQPPLRLVSFDPFRSLGIPGVRYIRPENYLAERELLLDADWVLFPEYWQVNSLHYALGRRLFPSVASYHLGHDKVEMSRAFAVVCPANLPETLILPASPAGVEEALDRLGLPCIAKVPRSSMGAGVHLLKTEAELRDWAASATLLYLQEPLPIRKDIRVVWIGDRVVTAYWRQAPDGMLHNNLARGGTILRDPVPEAAMELVTRLARKLGIDHAGFDVAMVDGHPYVLEFNTLFGTTGFDARTLALPALIHDWLLDRTRPPRSPSPPLAA